MAGGKETPRQRMMGILYLVLLGLVALQIPDSLLDAFKNITDSLNQSQKNVQTGITNTFDAFEKTKLKDQPERAKPFYDRAKQASQVASDFTNYVEGLKSELIKRGGGYDESIHDFKGRADMDISAHYMVDGKKGEELRQKINETREKLMGLLDPKDTANLKINLAVSDPPKNGEVTRKTWQEATFGEGIPMGASITALSKIQADAKNAENEVVKKILGKVDQAVVNLDQFSAVAVAPTSYVLVGQPYTAEVFLTAADSKSKPVITVGGSSIPVENGKGKYSGSTSSEGLHTWTGSIKVQQTDGSFKSYALPEQQYMVAKPSATVSPDKMNVLFIGVQNPISVSAPGIAKSQLHVSISNGSLSGTNGQYMATVNSPGDATVTVSGEISKGKTMVLGSTLFRIRRIPDPVAQFAGKSGGSTSSVNLKGQDRLFAKLENFYFDTKFDVVRFSMYIMKPRQDVIGPLTSNGPDLTPAMKQALSTIGPGSKVIFGSILAKGPGGERGLNDIVLSAN